MSAGIVITCDATMEDGTCAARTYVYTSSLDHAIIQARRAGWSVTPGARALCPAHCFGHRR